MGGLLHLVHQRGACAGCALACSPFIAVPNVTAHPSTASIPITVLLYDGPLLCSFNVAIKRLSWDVCTGLIICVDNGAGIHLVDRVTMY